MKEDQKQLSFGEGTVLRISAGHELALLGKQPVTDEEQLMYPAYRAALDALKGILVNSQEWLDLNCEDSDQYPRSREAKANLEELYTYSNNIIAFCGARGQGKTSAMLSFSHALPPMQKEEAFAADYKGGFSAADLDGTRFFVLPPVDPTMLGQNELVVELILARLLDEINEKWQAPDRSRVCSAYNYSDEDNKHAILECFNICMTGLQSEAKSEASGAEKLARAKDAFHVKEALWRIVRYFIYLLGCDLKHGYLVVQLDDTDMQFERAFSIMEEVRKYLSIPNVIVLMATDLEQLRVLVALHNAKALRRMADDPEVSRLATKYLDKLIPASHAIHLPTVKGQSEKKKQLYLHVIKNSERGKQPDANPDILEDNELEWCLFKLIHEKTGLVFIGHESYLHEIIPSTLRGVVQLYRMLDRMHTPKSFDTLRSVLSNDLNGVRAYYDSRYRSDRIKLNNLSLFEDYFIGDWVPSKLIPKYQDAFQIIQKSQDNRRIDIAIRYLLENAGKAAKGKEHTSVGAEVNINNAFFYFLNKEESGSLTPLKSASNTSEKENAAECMHGNIDSAENRILYVRLLCAIDEMKKDTDDDYRFVFALRTYFSILFSKAALMDELTSIARLKNLNFKEGIWAPLQYRHLLEMLTGTISRKEQESLLQPSTEVLGHSVITSLSELYDLTKVEKPNKQQYDRLVRKLLSSIIATLWEYSAAELPLQKDVEELWRQYTYILNP